MSTTTRRPELDEQLVELTRAVAPELEEEIELECGYCGHTLDESGFCDFCGATALTRPEPR